MRRLGAIGVAAFGLLLATWLLWPRAPEDDEALVRAAIAEMAEAASRKDLGGLLERVSESYRGEGGDKQGLKGYLLAWTMRSERLLVYPARIELTAPPADGRAAVTFALLLARTPDKRVEDLRQDDLAGSHRIEAEFAKEDAGRWRVVGARRSDGRAADWLP